MQLLTQHLGLLAMGSLLLSQAFGQGSVLLVGGGSEEYRDCSDTPYRCFVEHAHNRTILVLHYSTSSTFLPGHFQWFGVASASSLVIHSAGMANDSATYRAILSANGIFLRGGDQWQYVSRWKGTLAEQAIKEASQRGGVVGESSAGTVVLTEVVFDARVTSVDPCEALRNPLSAGISLTADFLGLVPGVLDDTHFYERGRLESISSSLMGAVPQVVSIVVCSVSAIRQRAENSCYSNSMT